MQLFERLCATFFLHTMPHLFPPAVIISNEDVFTALPYAKGRRFFDAVALAKNPLRSSCFYLKSTCWISVRICKHAEYDIRRATC